MSSYVDVIGNLTKNPETSTSQNGTVSCDLSIASSTSSKDREGNTKTVFFNVRVFGKHGEACAKYLSKGSKVFARGEFFPIDYKTKEGQDRVAFNINNANIEFLSTANNNQQSHAAQPTTTYKKGNASAVDMSQELPF